MAPKHSDDFKREAVRIATSSGLTRRIYSAPSADLAEAELDAFEEKCAGNGFQPATSSPYDPS
ncbi:hypothetical protein [Paracoccus seriniphilus]|uniref:Uncharacterized protein n=1 Tax=Paracoccus seriniphilus TaxID=184748 RepID=A0A239PZI4_9RHOB|nr:hypothetical protein [Paracoccus seriniphilus]WCR16031.1 hypothetical protein JHW44_18380 [Paracoccus seriniphilus]SNT75423.1 hypothetical protein SAMN05444959_11138 [Paracoccus seriniphilus]